MNCRQDFHRLHPYSTSLAALIAGFFFHACLFGMIFLGGMPGPGFCEEGQTGSVRLAETLADAGMGKFAIASNLAPGLLSPSVFQKYPNTAVGADGTIYAAWQEQDIVLSATAWDIKFAKYTLDSVSRRYKVSDTLASLRVDDTGSGTTNQENPKIAVSGTGSTAVLACAWQDKRKGADFDIYVARSTDAGESFYSNGNPNLKIPNLYANDGYNQEYPDVALDSAGAVNVVWKDVLEFVDPVTMLIRTEDRVFFSRMGRTEKAFSSPILVSRYNPAALSGTDDNMPSIGVDAKGYLHVAWHNDFGEIWYAWSTDGGVIWSDACKVSTTSSTLNEKPQLGVETKPDGAMTDYAHIVWRGSDSGNVKRIFYARVTPGSPVKVSESRILSKDGGEDYSALDVDPFGNINVSWVDVAGKRVVYTRSRDRGDRFYDPIQAYPVSGASPGTIDGASVSSTYNGNIAVSLSEINALATSSLVKFTEAANITPSLSWVGLYDQSEDTSTKTFVHTGGVVTDDIPVDIDTAFHVIFTKAMDASTLTSLGVQVYDSRGNRVAGTIASEPVDIVFDKITGVPRDKSVESIDYTSEVRGVGTMVSFTPSGLLGYSETYTFIVRSREPGMPHGVSDTMGYGFKFSNHYTDVTSNPFVFVTKFNTVNNAEYRVSEVYNSPNPTYDGITTINYKLHFDAEDASVKIYDSSGRMVRVLNGTTIFGKNQVLWDCTDEDGDNLNNGVYFFLVRARDAESGRVVEKWEKLAIVR